MINEMSLSMMYSIYLSFFVYFFSMIRLLLWGSGHERESTGGCLFVREIIFARTSEVAAPKCSIEQLF